MRNLKVGFTLAEVLITLAIIGVVAAITVPSMMQSTQKQEYVSALKKAYASVYQAYNLMLADNGGDATAVITGITHADDAKFLNELAKYLKVQKNCGIAMGCWYTTPLNWLNGTQNDADWDSSHNNKFGKAILADGSMVLIDIWNETCSGTAGSLNSSICGNFQIDINGAKGPNTLGRDYFLFRITKTGIYPIGALDDSYSCDATTAETITNYGCAAKVLTEGAMNY